MRTQVKQLSGVIDFTLFSKACTWPDRPRKRASEHFVNLPRAAIGLGDDPCPMGPPCVVTAIDADLAILSQADAPAPARLAALKFLGHWVGDVHQPLHVSFKDDRGAMRSLNGIRIKLSVDRPHEVDGFALVSQTLRSIYAVVRLLRDALTTKRSAVAQTGWRKRRNSNSD